MTTKKMNAGLFSQIAIAMSASVLLSSANAACLVDQPEIGDIGPASELVCESISNVSTNADIRIVDREIHSPDHVTVRVEHDGKMIGLDYQFAGFQWRYSAGTDVALRSFNQ